MAKLSANTIFQWVKNEIFNLWSKGEISIPITDGLTKDDCLVAYWQNEGEITVEFNGEKRIVPCNIKSKDVDYIARCIMHGFAQIYLNKNESVNKKMNKNRIRLTESDLHRIAGESVNKILKESSWADGQEMIQAYHIATVGAEDSSQEEADFAYKIYDRLTHNEMTADEAIRAITNGDLTPDTEPEVVSRDAVNFGTSNDGRYFLTYDRYTGTFDVWERTMNESINKNMNKKTVRLTESDLHSIIRESVKRILRESDNEFSYSDSMDLGSGKHRQTIIYNGKEIGYLFLKEKNQFAPIEELYLLPDIEYGLQDGWIDFKRFTDYNEAFEYASQNFEELAYLFENGDAD